jgi:hypothetical protein
MASPKTSAPHTVSARWVVPAPEQLLKERADRSFAKLTPGERVQYRQLMEQFKSEFIEARNNFVEYGDQGVSATYELNVHADYETKVAVRAAIDYELRAYEPANGRRTSMLENDWVTFSVAV